MRRGIAFRGQREGQRINVVHVHILRFHTVIDIYFEKRLRVTDAKRNHTGIVNIQLFDERYGRYLQLFLQKRTHIIHIFT